MFTLLVLAVAVTNNGDTVTLNFPGGIRQTVDLKGPHITATFRSDGTLEVWKRDEPGQAPGTKPPTGILPKLREYTEWHLGKDGRTVVSGKRLRANGIPYTTFTTDEKSGDVTEKVFNFQGELSRSSIYKPNGAYEDRSFDKGRLQEVETGPNPLVTERFLKNGVRYYRRESLQPSDPTTKLQSSTMHFRADGTLQFAVDVLVKEKDETRIHSRVTTEFHYDGTKPLRKMTEVRRNDTLSRTIEAFLPGGITRTRIVQEDWTVSSETTTAATGLVLSQRTFSDPATAPIEQFGPGK